MKYKVTYNNKTHIIDADSVEQAKQKVKAMDVQKEVDWYDFDEEVTKANRTIGSKFVELVKAHDYRTKGVASVSISCWSRGDMTIQEAQQFVKDIEKGIKAAQNFKYNGYTITSGK